MRKKVDGVKYKIPAVQKAFAIIELFGEDNRPRTLSEVSRTLAIPVSTTSSLLHTMQSCGYLNRSERGAYKLTMKLLAESHKAVGKTQLREIARTAMKKLTEATGLTSVLAIQDADQLVWIEKIEGTKDIRLAAQVGKRMHPHHTSSGKAILAHLPRAEFEQIVKSCGLPKFTPKTITTMQGLKRELAEVRRLGYAIDNGETAAGVRGAGAPIFDSSGKVIASVAIGGTVFDFDSNTKRMISEVKLSADKISEALGYSGIGGKPGSPH